MATSDDVAQVQRCAAEHGVLTLADGRQVPFIELTIWYLQRGSSHKAPPLAMSPDTARDLALLLQSAADKAPAPGRTPPSGGH